jgi:hypothetical protein
MVKKGVRAKDGGLAEAPFAPWAKRATPDSLTRLGGWRHKKQSTS